MNIDFFKLHVLKNDFLLCDLRNNKYPLLNGERMLSAAALAICDRRTGVGASGIIYLMQSGENEPVTVKTYASDGLLYENLIDSCMISSRYIFDTTSINGKIIRIINNSINFSMQILDSMNFRISTGKPLYDDSVSENLVIDDYSYNFTKVRLQKNGIVFFPVNKNSDELKELSRKLLRSSAYADTVPIFCFTSSRSSINIKTWGQTRHPDNTLMCCLASVASSLNGYDNEILVTFHKNISYVEWDRANNEVYASAKPEYVFTGSYYFDEKTVF